MKQVIINTKNDRYEVAYNSFTEKTWGVIFTYVEEDKPVTKYVPWTSIVEITLVIA